MFIELSLGNGNYFMDAKGLYFFPVELSYEETKCHVFLCSNN